MMAAYGTAVNFIVVFYKKRNWNTKREMIFKELGVLSFSGHPWQTGALFSHKKNAMKKMCFLVVALWALYGSTPAYAQNMYVATNLLDYANIGTINVEFGLTPLPQWSFYAKGRYNPFTLKLDRQIQNRVASAALGAKYWFWYSNAGWFVNSHLSCSIYNTGGIWNSRAYQGQAVSLSAGGGYSLILNEKLNLDFGAGIQGGYTSYTEFACPKCGKELRKGKKIFVAPSNLMVQLSLIL